MIRQCVNESFHADRFAACELVVIPEVNVIQSAKTKVRLLLGCIVVVSIMGCVNQYHLGYHHLGDGKLGNSIVSNSSAEGLEPFEEHCIKDFADYKTESLRSVFAPKIDQALDNAQLSEINSAMKSRYDFTGTYERLKLVSVKFMLDEAATSNAFEYYDLVGADYLLKGSADAVVRLYMVKINGGVRLAGFEIMDYDANPKGNNKKLKYIFPESIDKAGITKRHNTRVQ